MAAEVQFDQAVATFIGRRSERCLFLFPYEGRITQPKIHKMAMRLHQHMRDNDVQNSVLEDAQLWLSMSSTATKLRNVTLRYNDGSVDVSGIDREFHTWEHRGLDPRKVIVLSQDVVAKRRRKW